MIYPRRYVNEPRKRRAYEEACDMVAIYGLPRKMFRYWIFNISRTEMKEIWNFAVVDMNGKSKFDVIAQ